MSSQARILLCLDARANNLAAPPFADCPFQTVNRSPRSTAETDSPLMICLKRLNSISRYVQYRTAAFKATSHANGSGFSSAMAVHDFLFPAPPLDVPPQTLRASEISTCVKEMEVG